VINVNAAELATARFETSKNELLTTVFGVIQVYNSGVVAEIDKPDLLERLLITLGTWITSHAPKPTALNQVRWTAMEHLAEAISAEADSVVGVRMLAGPANWKTIDGTKRSYWLEKLDPDHRPGFVLSPKFADWRNNGKQKTVWDPAQSFWDYIGTAAAGTSKVAYYESVGSAAEDLATMTTQAKSRVEFRGNQLFLAHDNSLFDTKKHTTCASGNGWAIFVLSPQGELYAGSHIEGKLHHSTFLAGGAVVAAGEMHVVAGDVRAINSKSGHYCPSRRNMHAMVSRLVGIPGAAIILPEFLKRPFPAHKVSDFRIDVNTPTKVKKAELEARLEGEAKKASWIANVEA
jgi:hypothetical protein